MDDPESLNHLRGSWKDYVRRGRRRRHAGGRHHAWQRWEKSLTMSQSQSGGHLFLPFGPAILEPGLDLK